MSPAAARTVELAPGGQAYRVRIGAGVLDELPAALRGRPAIAVADEHVLELHGARLPGELRTHALPVPRGEAAKTWAVLGHLLERVTAAGLGRDGVLVALGGGATSDLAGLAAALHRRGIDWIACPTTLLSQVDAAVGGKTAVDLGGIKNAIGAFHQPAAVLADTDTLGTLDPAEFKSGLGELLKAALLDGEAALARLEACAPSLEDGPAWRSDALLDCVAAAVALKARVVAADERESGPREALNLGHTFAHAIEFTAGLGAVPHGCAVSVGLTLALALAAESERLAEPELPARTARLQRALGLPRTLADIAPHGHGRAPLGAADLTAAMRHDKKTRAGRARLVLPLAAGRVERGVEVPWERLERFLERAAQEPER